MPDTQTKDNRFLVVTGLSGSGKTAFSRFLEDLGYYCIDNLPAKLIGELVDMWLKKKVEMDRVALVVDIREPRFVQDFPRIFQEVKKRFPLRLIFLEASDATLVKRFSETRRLHPLARNRTVLQAVRLERKRLEPVKKMADEVVDTTNMSVSEMKEHVVRDILKRRVRRFQVVVISFGYKYGLPLESDLVFDTRFLPNPFYVDRLRNLSGKTRGVRKYVLAGRETRAYLDHLFRFMDFLIPMFIKEGKSTLTVSVGCTGGKHRSVVIAEELRARLRRPGLDVRTYHRDLYK